MGASSKVTLVAAVGDIHGRFHRVREWFAALEAARGRPIDLCLAVGDVEAFRTPDDQRRKATKRSMPAEFSDYATGRCTMDRTLYFIAGNNEDFEALHGLPEGGEIAPKFYYLGRVGVRTLAGLRVAYLSGIYAPRYIDKPLLEPVSPGTIKQAGYFRTWEVQRLENVRNVDLMVVHEWPRGIVSRRTAHATSGRRRELKAWRVPWIGNPVTRSLVEVIKPSWLLCGHSHIAYASVIEHPDGRLTRIACLDQAARPDGAVVWIEWEQGRPVRAGWGISGKVAWQEGEVWDESKTPEAGVMERPWRRPVVHSSGMGRS